jgi:hypothetical protein
MNRCVQNEPLLRPTSAQTDFSHAPIKQAPIKTGPLPGDFTQGV